MTTLAITGAGGALGGAVAAAHADHHVIGVDVRGAEITADLSNAGGRDDAIATVLDACGGSLDRLVVAAGLGPQVPDSALIVSVNFFGSVAFLDGLLDALARGDHPAAVAVSSNSSTIDPTADDDLVAACLAGDEEQARSLAAKLPGNTAYCTSKRALAIATRMRVGEWGARGVRLNAVAPGPFQSALLQGGLDDPAWKPLIEALPIPVGGRAEPAEIASVIAFLLSPEARFVHGTVMYVDGGTDALFFPNRVP